jgi:hypothetical protein
MAHGLATLIYEKQQLKRVAMVERQSEAMPTSILRTTMFR